MKIKRKMLILVPILFLLVSFGMLVTGSCFGQEDLKPYVDQVEHAQKGMTVWQTILSGGWTMVWIALLSIAGGAIIIHCFMNLKIEMLAPREFADEIIKKMERREPVDKICEAEENIFSKMVLAGLKRKGRGPGAAREAIENCERNEIGNLWQLIGFLSDIAVIAPLLGLLGTILGMIQAFNVIAFQTAVVKPILMAAGVSKAMVTTAFGLIVAIPAMLFHAYFRKKVYEIASNIESYRPDIVKIIEQS